MLLVRRQATDLVSRSSATGIAKTLLLRTLEPTLLKVIPENYTAKQNVCARVNSLLQYNLTPRKTSEKDQLNL